jgi:hypothetical protein
MQNGRVSQGNYAYNSVNMRSIIYHDGRQDTDAPNTQTKLCTHKNAGKTENTDNEMPLASHL